MNDQHKKRMDFGTGGARHQMSPEMMEAQRRLAEKMKEERAQKAHAPRPTASVSRVSRTQTGRTASGAAFTRTQTRTSVSYSSNQPISQAQSTQNPQNPARPRIRPQGIKTPAPQVHNHAQSPQVAATARPQATSKSPLARGPMTAPHSKRRHGTNTPVEPRGPQGTANLETLEFDALDKLAPNSSPVVPNPTPVNNAAKSSAKQPQKSEKKKSILPGKSPFINTVNVEKRPLSGHMVNKKNGLAPKSPRPQAYVPPNDNVPTVVNTKRKNRKSNIALAIAIFFTVILGAVVGTFVYLAFFQ